MIIQYVEHAKDCLARARWSALGMNISQRITGQEIKKRKKLREGGPTAHKPQAASLTRRILNDKVKTMNEKQLKRIADAIEEILRLVKKDMEPKK